MTDDMIPLVKSMIALCNTIANGGILAKNPYAIPEYKAALIALSEAIGYKGHWMDVLNSKQALIYQN